MVWLFVVLSALTTFAIAAVAVGSAANRQAARVRRAVYDVGEAVDFVADRLPHAISSQVSYDDVRAAVVWQIEFLQRQGLATYRIDGQATEDLVVVADAEPVAYVLGMVADADEDSPGSALTDEQVVAILAVEEEYRASIGGFGPAVADVALE